MRGSSAACLDVLLNVSERWLCQYDMIPRKQEGGRAPGSGIKSGLVLWQLVNGEWLSACKQELLLRLCIDDVLGMSAGSDFVMV